jgi:hypothetical protein
LAKLDEEAANGLAVAFDDLVRLEIRGSEEMLPLPWFIPRSVGRFYMGPERTLEEGIQKFPIRVRSRSTRDPAYHTDSAFLSVVLL